MIIKFDKYNESIKNLLIGPSEDEMWDTLRNLSPDELLRRSCSSGFINGIKVAIERGANIEFNNYTIFKNLEENPNKELSDFFKEYLKLPDDPKDFVFENINGAKITKNKNYDKYITDYRGVSNNTFWEKDNEIILEQDPKSNRFHNLLYVHPKIWCILTGVYGLDFNDKQNIINDVVEKILNLNKLYPLEHERNSKYSWKNYK